MTAEETTQRDTPKSGRAYGKKDLQNTKFKTQKCFKSHYVKMVLIYSLGQHTQKLALSLTSCFWDAFNPSLYPSKPTVSGTKHALPNSTFKKMPQKDSRNHGLVQTLQRNHNFRTAKK